MGCYSLKLNCVGMVMETWLGIIVFVIKLGSFIMDIVMLEIAINNNCGAGVSTLDPLDTASWMFVGAVTDLLILSIFCSLYFAVYILESLSITIVLIQVFVAINMEHVS